LVSLGSDNSWFECVGFPILSRDIRERINEYGNLLGYESLSKRLLGDVEQLDEGGATKRQEWPSPIPLGGEVLSGFQRRYNRLRNTIFDDTKSDLPLKYERLQKALAIADDWHASLPSSIEARLIRIQILFLREELAIQLDLVHDLEEELMIIDAEIGKFFRDAPEYVDSHRDISWHLYSLGRTILAQHFDDDAKRPRMFWAAAKCLSGSFEILNGDRHRASVTQAVALNMCSISHLIALSNDMLKQTELAAWHRSRRDSILRHVLLLDPNNDRAVSLAKLYEVNPLRSGSLSAEIEEEVSSWRWSIIPLVPSV
jgi:hypothetical protein